MNKLLTLFLAFAVIQVSIAQKVKDDATRVKYLRLPQYVLDKEYNTFSAEVVDYGNQLEDIGIYPASLSDEIQFDAYSKVSGGGEIHVKFYFSGYGSLNPTVKEAKQKDGSIKYYCTYTYKLPMRYEVYAGGSLATGAKVKEISDKKTEFTFKGKQFTSSSAARSDWKKTTIEAAKKDIAKNFQEKFKIFQKQLKDAVDYQKTTDLVFVCYLKSNKKFDFTEFEGKKESFIQKLKGLGHGKNRKAFKADVQAEIDYWEKTLSESDPNDKDSDKLYLVSAINLAYAYYWCDDMGNAQSYLEKAKQAKGKIQVKGIIERDIAYRKKRLAILDEEGIDPYTGVEPASMEEIQAIEAAEEQAKIEREAEIAARIAREEAEVEARLAAQAAKTAPVIDTVPGYVTGRDGKNVDCIFLFYHANTGSKEGEIYFIPEGESYEQELVPMNAASAKIGPDTYRTVRHYDATGLGKEVSIMKEMFSSDKIDVFEGKYVDDEKRYINTYYYFRKKGETYATNSSSLTFEALYKKKLAKYFEDCPAIVTKINANEYPNSPDSRVLIAADYTEQCK